jgi:hypothetical protein
MECFDRDPASSCASEEVASRWQRLWTRLARGDRRNEASASEPASQNTPSEVPTPVDPNASEAVHDHGLLHRM